MASVKTRAAKTVLWFARRSPALKQALGRRRVRARQQSFEGGVQLSSQRYTIVARSDHLDEPRVGIYLRGACDLPALFAMAPLLRNQVRGSCAIFRDSIEIGGSRSDILLQTIRGLDGVPPEILEDTIRQLRLKRHYFEPVTFQPSFSVPGRNGSEVFPKTVVALSIAGDFSRKLYRHRSYGFLVDPGGWWLTQDMGQVLGNLEVAKWFQSTFESVGRLSIEDFRRNMGEVVRLLKSEVGAHVIVFNTLVMDPANRTHNYQLLKESEMRRRREFVVALFDLSSELDFSVVDVDRILKSSGIRNQVDFAHFSQEQFGPIAEECFRILSSLDVL